VGCPAFPRPTTTTSTEPTPALRATQAKLVALRALEEQSDVAVALGRFDSRVVELAERTRAEPTPAGLALFRDDVVAALERQRRFFVRAGAVRLGGGSMGDVYALPEGRQASRRLIAAWREMQARYPAWDPATRDSIYHHLCALDPFQSLAGAFRSIIPLHSLPSRESPGLS